jgi:Nuclease-related domain
MTEFVETRWKRYGKDRIYVRTADGVDAGFVDLVAKSAHPAAPEFAGEVDECLARWCAQAADAPAIDAEAPVNCAPEPSTSRQEPAPVIARVAPPARDLIENRAGASARAKREQVNARAPVANFVSRVLGVKTEERSWRVGMKGEEMVGDELAKLGEGWHFLHAVEVGDRGADIDHVVVGPAGVFTLNTKRHPDGKATVAARSIYVNGSAQSDYLRDSAKEATRATTLLSAACGYNVQVTPMIVFVDLIEFTVKSPPDDVLVTTRKRVRDLLHSLPKVVDPETVEAVFAHARLSTTWRPKR